jgi:hypothetical protein
VPEVAEDVRHVRQAVDHDAAPGDSFGEVDRLAVYGERDVTEDRHIEAGGGDDDVGGDLLTGADPYPVLGERLDGVGDDRGLPLAQRREQIAVRDHGDALLPRAVAGREVLVDVEALGQQWAHGLDQESMQLVGRLERHPGQRLLLRDVLPAHDLVHPLVGEIEWFQLHGELVFRGRGEEVGGGALQHRHVLRVRGYRGDQRRGRRAGADHNHALAREVELLRPPLRVHDRALETIEAFPPGLVGLGVVVIALAHPQEVGGEPQLLASVVPGDLDRPPAVVGRPAGRGDPVPVADVLVEAVLLDDLVEVGEDLPARRDRRPAPRLEPVAVGEQVAVRAHARVPVGPPGSAPVVLGVQDDKCPVGELVPQVVRGTDAGNPGADDEDVDMAGVPDLLGTLSGSGHGCSRRHDWTSGTRARMSAILAVIDRIHGRRGAGH